jgi:hypothetical protein
MDVHPPTADVGISRKELRGVVARVKAATAREEVFAEGDRVTWPSEGAMVGHAVALGERHAYVALLA